MTQTFLGFDYGEYKIGVAVGQTVTGTAEGVATIRMNNPIGPWPEIQKLIEAWQPDALIVGLALTFDKIETKLSTKSRAFGQQLCTRFDLPVNFIDETLTSSAADAIIRETTTVGKSITRRRKMIRDRLAAELILQTYLNDISNTQSK